MHKSISLSAAVEKIPEGATLMIGGFMGIGSPHRLIGELVRQCRTPGRAQLLRLPDRP
jgi:acetate CoA/acetoacetate CoA-transferase alpha subunit